MKIFVETVAAPYTSVTYIATVEACNLDRSDDYWTDEIEVTSLEKSFDYLSDALHYLDTFTDKYAERIASEHGRTCLHVSIDKCWFINGEHQESMGYVAGVFWVDSERTTYVTNDAYLSKPW